MPIPITYYLLHIAKVGQNHIHTVYIRYFWQGNHQIYGAYIRFWPTLPIPITHYTLPIALTLCQCQMHSCHYRVPHTNTHYLTAPYLLPTALT